LFSDKNLELSEILFPHIKNTVEHYENIYPERELEKKSEVTRFAPSPTGFIHLGGIYAALIAERVAHMSDGVFFLRIEDTDKKREVLNGVEKILSVFENFQINFDEGLTANGVKGDYAPYVQSERVEIYQTCVKELVKKGFAYPCFMTAEELDEIRAEQEADKLDIGCFGEYARHRNLSNEEIKTRIENGEQYVIRLKCPVECAAEKKTRDFKDVLKSNVNMPENFIDVVLLKSDGIPTYHFAHVVDDHFMRTTIVSRGDEWLSSLPIHVQLFDLMEWHIPKFAHISPIMKQEGDNKRKLSKRKDPEATMDYYSEKGYPVVSVIEYLLTIANSNYEDWAKTNPDESYENFPFKITKMSKGGSLFDIDKLNSVSRNIIGNMEASEVLDGIKNWAKTFDTELFDIIMCDEKYVTDILSIDRYVKNPRKDIEKYSDFKLYFGYFFEEYFNKENTDFPFEKFSKEDGATVLKDYAEIYSENDDNEEWFNKIKSVTDKNGFSSNMKEYKKNPDDFKGSVSDVSTLIRLAITGKINSPDMFRIKKLLGQEKVINRINQYIENISK